jgi:enoyl-CoA hydratase
MAEPVNYALDGRIATIELDDGKVNAFSIPMLKAIHAAFDRAEEDGAVVLLTGREGYFSAGFDLKVFSDHPEQIVEMLTLGATLCERVLSFPTPVLVACSGHAIAAGSFLPLAADLRIGVEGPFKLGLNEVRIGLTVPLFVIELARQRLTPAHFDRAVVNATMYGPEEAIAAGFLDRVVPPDELRAVSLEAAEDLASLNPEAHKATKLRARNSAIEAVRGAIEAELTANSCADLVRSGKEEWSGGPRSAQRCRPRSPPPWSSWSSSCRATCSRPASRSTPASSRPNGTSTRSPRPSASAPASSSSSSSSSISSK